MYWGTARYEKIVAMEISQITKKGASFELLIRKGKCNQTRKLQRMVVHPNSCTALGNYCPVKVLEVYLSARLRLDPASGNDWLFPNLNSTYGRFSVQTVSIAVPCTQFSYVN